MIRAVITILFAITLLTDTPSENKLTKNITLPIITENKHNPIFDNFIKDKAEQGYDCIESTFTDDFVNHLVTVCEEQEINPWLILSVMEVESGFDPNAKAYDGSKHYGLMQLSTVYFTDALKEEGTDDFFDAKANVTVAIKEIKRLLTVVENYNCVKKSSLENPDIACAILCYHKGQIDGTRMFKEEGTIDDYTEKVLDKMTTYQKKYKDSKGEQK